MKLKVKQHSAFSKPVKIKDVHGKFPYKYYFELFGSNNSGRIVTVVSNTEILGINDGSVVLEVYQTGANKITKVVAYKAKPIDPVTLSDDDIYVFEINQKGGFK